MGTGKLGKNMSLLKKMARTQLQLSVAGQECWARTARFSQFFKTGPKSKCLYETLHSLNVGN